MTGLWSAVSLSTRQLVVELVLAQNLQLKALGRLFEDALRALALLQDRLNRRGRADRHLDRRRQQHRELVDHRQIGRIRDDDDERCALAAVGNEAVAQHQVRGNRAEQLVIDAELRQIDERQAVALGEPARVRRLGRLLGGCRFRDADVQVVGLVRGRCRGLTVHSRLSASPCPSVAASAAVGSAKPSSPVRRFASSPVQPVN